MEKTTVTERLFSMQDTAYRAFHCKLMPTVDPARVIGVRVPILRKFAKELAKTSEAEAFLQQLPHTYYEENNLHAFLLEQIRDFDEALAAVEAFLPYIDNWATCDSAPPKALLKDRARLLEKCREWMASDAVYPVRYGIGVLMRWFLDTHFEAQHLEWVAAVESEEYYVNMMRAWYFATALAKQYDRAVLFLEQRRLDAWTHNKTIRKAIESYRITEEQKAYLRTLSVKKP